MRKTLLTILIGSIGILSGHASPAINLEEETTSIREDNNVGITPDDPLPPIIIAAYFFWYDSDKSALFIRTPAWPYHIFAVLENFTTGESNYYSFDDLFAEGISIPFTGGIGIWRLSLCSAVPHEPCILFDWYFTIDKGIITHINPQGIWNY